MEIIDRNQLTECMTGELELDRDLVQSALEEIDNRIADLHVALMTKEYDGWRMISHRLVGTTATLGFKALAEECRNAELRTTNDFERTALLEKMKTCLASTRQALSEMGLH